MEKVKNVPHMKLKSIRALLNIHQLVLSKMLQTNPTTYSHKENGKKEFKITEIKTILNYLNEIQKDKVYTFEDVFF